MVVRNVFYDGRVSDGSELGTHPDWYTISFSGSGQVTSDQHGGHTPGTPQVMDMSTLGEVFSVYAYPTDTDDVDVEVGAMPDKSLNDASYNNMGVVCRLPVAQPSSAQVSCYFAILIDEQGTSLPGTNDTYHVRLYKVVNGVATVITTVATGIPWSATMYPRGLRIRATGSSPTVNVKVWAEGTLWIDHDDSDADRIQTGKYHGRYSHRGWSNSDGQPFQYLFRVWDYPYLAGPAYVDNIGSYPDTAEDAIPSGWTQYNGGGLANDPDYCTIGQKQHAIRFEPNPFNSGTWRGGGMFADPSIAAPLDEFEFLGHVDVPEGGSYPITGIVFGVADYTDWKADTPNDCWVLHGQFGSVSGGRGELRLEEVVAGSPTTLVSNTSESDFSYMDEEMAWWMRVRYESGTCYARIWRDSVVEPVTWQIQQAISGYSAGAIGVFARSTARDLDMYWRDITIEELGGTPPTFDGSYLTDATGTKRRIRTAAGQKASLRLAGGARLEA